MPIAAKAVAVSNTGMQVASKALISTHIGNKAEYQKDTKKSKTQRLKALYSKALRLAPSECPLRLIKQKIGIIYHNFKIKAVIT